MRTPPNRVLSDGDTARVLRVAAASGQPIRVDTGEAVYRVDANIEDVNNHDDPEWMIRALHAHAGILQCAGVASEQLERDV